MIKKLYKKLKKNLHLILPISFFVFIFSAIVFGDVLAAGEIQTKFQVPFGEIKTGSVTTIAQYINAIYKYLVAAGGVLAGIIFAIGGFMYVSSAGDENKVKQGKKYIINAILGLLLLVSSYVILDTINPNATVLKDIVPKAVKGDALTQPHSKGCPCDSDSDCKGNFYCETLAVPYNPSTAKDSTSALKTLGFVTSLMSVTSLIAIMPGVAAFSQAGTKIPGIIKGLGLILKKTATVTLKTLAKHWGKAAALSFLLAVSGVVVSLSDTDFTIKIGEAVCKDISDPDGICVANVGKYNLIPPGLNTDGLCAKGTNKCGIFSLYKSNGDLPERETYNANGIYYVEPNTGIVGEASFTFKGRTYQGRADKQDACYTDKDNRCPCIKWLPGKKFVECAKQARCVEISYSGGPAPVNGFTYCLLGSQGELCIDDSDCRSGLKCMDMEDKLKKEGISGDNLGQRLLDYSLFRQFLKTFKTDGVGGEGTIDGKVDRDKICWPSGDVNNKSLLGETCALGYKCEEGLGLSCNKTDYKVIKQAGGTYKASDIEVCDGPLTTKTIKLLDQDKLQSLISKYNVDNKVWAYVMGEDDSFYSSFPDNINHKSKYEVFTGEYDSTLINGAYWRDFLNFGTETDTIYKDAMCVRQSFQDYLFNSSEVKSYLRHIGSYKKIGPFVYVEISVNEYDTFKNYCKTKVSNCTCELPIESIMVLIHDLNDSYLGPLEFPLIKILLSEDVREYNKEKVEYVEIIEAQ